MTSTPGDNAVAALHRVTSHLAGSEERPGQDDMARAIADALAKRRHIIAQAGTGTGKSLAYLVPAILSSKKIVVATATKALQDQLDRQDLPQLAEHLDVDFTWAVVKGRNNYVCLQRLEELQKTDDQFDFDELSERSKREVVDIIAWSKETSTGDMEELTHVPLDRTRLAVTIQSDECPGATKCPIGESCFAERARAAASSADVIVVNLHLYGLHIAGGGGLLPEHDIVIFDEVHQLESTMSDTVGAQLNPSTFASLAAVVRRVLTGDTANPLLDASDKLSVALSAHVGKRLPSPLPDFVALPLNQARQALNDILNALRNITADDLDTTQRRQRAQSQCTRLSDQIDVALGMVDNYVAYVQGSTERPSLRISPLSVGHVLDTAVWQDHLAILTSATVPLTLPSRVGLPIERTDEISVSSPFDFERNARLYCSPEFPDRNSSEFENFVHDELEALITAAGGRTLALFTSNNAMKAATTALRSRVPFPILSPSEHTRSQIIKLFLQDEASCIFASQSFFQGVDLPGRTLSLVVLDKLPFPRPDDPLLEARREAVGRQDSFSLIDLPMAATSLAQAAGRLIRSTTDMGVVAVLDRRLATMNYRSKLLGVMPPMARTRNRAEVEDFLRHITRPADTPSRKSSK